MKTCAEHWPSGLCASGTHHSRSASVSGSASRHPQWQQGQGTSGPSFPPSSPLGSSAMTWCFSLFVAAGMGISLDWIRPLLRQVIDLKCPFLPLSPCGRKGISFWLDSFSPWKSYRSKKIPHCWCRLLINLGFEALTLYMPNWFWRVRCPLMLIFVLENLDIYFALFLGHVDWLRGA